MFSYLSFSAAHAVRWTHCYRGAWARPLTWRSSGKTVSMEEMVEMLQSPTFMNNMTRVVPGDARTRICSLDVEADKTLQFPRTVYEALKNAASMNTVSNNICGWIDPATEQLKFLSYDQFYKESHSISMAYRELGIGPKDFAAVSWINSKEFLEVMFGTTSLNTILQPLYPNLDAQAVKYLIKQGEPKIYLCDNESKARLVIDSSKEMPFLKTLVVGRTRPNRDLVNDAKSAGIQVLGMDDFLKLGENKKHELTVPSPEDIFTLIYTSGTTGNPKGAIITHECIMRACHMIATSVGPLKARPGEYTFCYMPTGHIYEVLFELLVLSYGGTTVFWRGDVRKMLDDMKIIRPHYIPMVPRIMNKIYDGVCEKLTENRLKQAIFMFCYDRKKRLLQRGIRRNDTIYDKLVFNKIQNLLGGRVNSIITSSAPLSAEVMEFFKVSLGCYISEVYGSTETLVVSGTSPYDPTGGHLGGPFPSVEVKLIDVPELGYYAKDNVGEICVRSPYRFRGYYKNKESTDETIVDGWVVTGDVGRWTDRGTLVIIDRKKDIFKLSQGEYVAPEKVESVYARMEQVANIFVEGRGDQRFCVAIVVPEEAAFRHWLRDHHFENEADQPLEEICLNIQIRKAFLEEMRNFGTAHDLGNLQQIRNLHLEKIPFTVDSGLLTSTLKLKRNIARDAFTEKINQLYAEGSLVDKNV